MRRYVAGCTTMAAFMEVSARQCSSPSTTRSLGGRIGNTKGFGAAPTRQLVRGSVASLGGIARRLRCGKVACSRTLDCKSRMRRESHVRFREQIGKHTSELQSHVNL